METLCSDSGTPGSTLDEPPAGGAALHRGRQALAVMAACALAAGCGGGGGGGGSAESVDEDQATLIAQGQQIFRFDTFGDEVFWTDTLQMHTVISAAVDPETALSVGLKVDAEALPAAVVEGIQNGTVDLKSPATTLALLALLLWPLLIVLLPGIFFYFLPFAVLFGPGASALGLAYAVRPIFIKIEKSSH